MPKTVKKYKPAAEPGDIKFVDANNDGVINDDDRVFQGSPFPDFTFALNGNMRYKNFDLSIGLQGVLGNKIYNATRQTLEDVTKGSNFLASCLDYWTPENKNASHPRLTWMILTVIPVQNPTVILKMVLICVSAVFN